MNTQAMLRKQYKSNHLRTLLDGFVEFEANEFADAEVHGLCIDSRLIEEGDLFLACAGSHSFRKERHIDHGIAYAGQAINAGARFIAWEPTDEVNDLPLSCIVSDNRSIPLIRVEKLHEKLGIIAARYYQNPSEALTMIGVTGTNGKTSTTHFIVQLLTLLNKKDDVKINNTCALIGTLGNGVYPQLNEATHTTPDALNLQKLLAEFRRHDVDTVVMEVSSHALAQDRTSNVLFDIAAFTNLSRDHLDYHGDMQNYAQEKLKLFQFPSLKTVILNADDEFSTLIVESLADPEQFENSQPQIIRVSQMNPETDFYVEKVVPSPRGLEFSLCYQQQEYCITARLIGQFNVDNLLIAIAALITLGYEIKDIIDEIKNLQTVSGRMEIIYPERNIDNSDLPTVVVDYAHTPDALQKALISLRAHCENHLICVFGCGGERDIGKRSQMAEVAECYADKVIVTTDNPRSEKIDAIINDILSGFSANADIRVLADRALAIENAIQCANVHDVILIAGKGHEIYQEINGNKLPFSDKEVVLKVFGCMENKQ